MEEDLLEKNEDIIIVNTQDNKQFNYTKLFLIIDIVSFILTLFFTILFVKALFIIFLCLTIIFTFALIISLYLDFKRKEKEKEKVELERQEKKKREIKEEELIQIQEKKEREIKKKEILERQSEFRKKEQSDEKNLKTEENKKTVIEDMCVLGSIMKQEIIEEKQKEPEKFVPIEEAIKEENKDNQTFCLGVLAQNLENLGITTAIEKNSSDDIESQEASNTVLQFITNGMINKKKYDFHFDLGEERNNELLKDKEEQIKFNNKLRKKLSIEYNIPEDKIIVTNPQKGSYSVQVIFETEAFNKSVDINTLKGNCNDKEFEELKNLKNIKEGLIMEGCKLSQGMLDPKGNRESGWGENEKRGGFDYFPPKGWKGYGLKVKGCYDHGNDDWLAYDGNENEWAVAYHGIGTRGGLSVENATNNIFKGGFKYKSSAEGGGQAYSNYKNDNPRYRCDNKEKDYSNLIGDGVYCSPDPQVMEEYAAQAYTKANNKGKEYLIGFMMRVKPDKIRYSNSEKNYWVLDGTKDEMRPYRIMIKEYKKIP